MTPNPTCAACGAELGADAPHGLCARCLLTAGLAGPPTAHASEAATMVRSTESSTVNSGSPAPVEAPRESIDRRIRYFGDYELVDEIARGGMGVVYKARQSSLNRLVAVKMIRSGEFASPDEVRRFHLEAEAAANLRHPNIVSIHEVGEHEGRHYFSMDLIDGSNLAQHLRERPLSPRDAAALVKTLADATHFAHQRGTLHRDLKPQNVLIDSSGHPHITDFGLAKQTHSEVDATQTGAVLGSPGYMSPEQARGRQDLVGPASDVHSLGAILYHLLTGNAPFRGEHPVAVLQQVIEQEPTPPSRLAPNIPADLETICLKCLEKRPERRYSSARELAEELNRFICCEPILARRASAGRKAWNWCRQRPWVFTGAAALITVVLLAVAFGLWEQNRFLRWDRLNPDTKPVDPWPVEFKVPVFFAAILGTPVALIWYFALWSRRQRAVAVSRLFVGSAIACGVALAVAGITATLLSISENVWTRSSLRADRLGPFPLFFVACWTGAVLVWHSLREQERAWHGGAAMAAPRRRIHVNPMLFLLMPALGICFWLIAGVLIAAGQFLPESLILGNGLYIGTPADEAQWRKALREFFPMVAGPATLLPLVFKFWRISEPPWRELNPLGTAFALGMIIMTSQILPVSLWAAAVGIGLLAGTVVIHLADIRTVDASTKVKVPLNIDRKAFAMAFLLVCAALFGAAWLFVPGPAVDKVGFAGRAMMLSLWPLGYAWWRNGTREHRKVLVIGLILYVSVMGNEIRADGLSAQHFGIPAGVIAGFALQALIRRKRRSN